MKLQCFFNCCAIKSRIGFVANSSSSSFILTPRKEFLKSVEVFAIYLSGITNIKDIRLCLKDPYSVKKFATIVDPYSISSKNASMILTDILSVKSKSFSETELVNMVSISTVIHHAQLNRSFVKGFDLKDDIIEILENDNVITNDVDHSILNAKILNAIQNRIPYVVSDSVMDLLNFLFENTEYPYKEKQELLNRIKLLFIRKMIEDGNLDPNNIIILEYGNECARFASDHGSDIRCSKYMLTHPHIFSC